MKSVKIFKIALFIILPFILTACVSIKSGPEAGSGGGFFLTQDGGDKWANRSSIYTADATVKTFTSANITKIAFDPQDQAAVYLGTQNNGMYYSYNYGQGWHNALGDKGAINDIVVHPENKCVVYVAAHNRIWKTEDCARTWVDHYFEARDRKYVTALNINYKDPNIVYAGNNDGAFLRSLDQGLSWDVLYRLPASIKQIIVQNHSDSNIIYAITSTKGVWRSADGGVTWDDLMSKVVYELETIKDGEKTFTAIKKTDEDKAFFKISGVGDASAAESDLSVPDSLIYANRIGMFRFTGDHWEQYPLLTPKNKELIYALTVNPLNGSDIYYGTANALYHTLDGGASWIIKELPTTRAVSALSFAAESKLLYLGFFKIEK
jgi:photosystem II stability/assembly factor-like uncharacterized protein